MGLLEKKVAIVTGGASGIGAATLRRFAAEGARVVCADVNEEKGSALVAEICNAGGVAAFRHADVTQLTDLQEVVAFAISEHGGLDIMHNNAAATGGGYVADIDPEVWRWSLDVMLNGVFYGIKAAVPALLARGGGSIINTASVEGLFGEIMSAAYCTAKASELHLARCLALEGAPDGIRVNVVNPDAVLRGSKIWSGEWLDQRASTYKTDKEGLEEMYRQRSLLKRSVLPEDVAEAILFFASDVSAK